MRSSQFDLEFSYDLAISLLSRDAELVAQFYDEVSKHVRGPIFFYAPMQRELMGEHAPSVFADVFRNRAKVVVVFHRKGWGSAGYTLIENNAICDRYVQGADPRGIFVVQLDDADVPAWYSSSRMIWASYPAQTLKDLVAVTADRVATLGGTIGQQSVVEKARHLRERREAAERREQALRGQGHLRFSQEFPTLIETLVRRVAELKAQAGVDLAYTNAVREQHAVVCRGETTQTLHIEPEHAPYSDVARILRVTYINGAYSLQGRVHPRPDVAERSPHMFEPVDDTLWLWGRDRQPLLSTAQLVDELLDRLIERAFSNDPGPRIRFIG